MTGDTKTSTVNKKIKKLIEQVQSPDITKVNSALDALQVNGNEHIIEPLFDLIDSTPHEANKKVVLEFLANLKHSPSLNEVMACLRADRYLTIRQEILYTIWNSPLDYSPYLAEFVRIAVSSDFMTTLECLTVIENLDGPFEEASILESQLLLGEYLQGKHSKTPEKDQLISEIALFIKDFDQNLSELDGLSEV